MHYCKDWNCKILKYPTLSLPLPTQHPCCSAPRDYAVANSSQLRSVHSFQGLLGVWKISVGVCIVHLQNCRGKGVGSTDWGKAVKISYRWWTNIVSVGVFANYFQPNQDLVIRQFTYAFYRTFESVWFQKFTLIWLCFLLCASHENFLLYSCGNICDSLSLPQWSERI